MRRIFISAIATFCLFVAVTNAFSQANNAAIGGVVADTTKALIPGVTVTLTNVDTGVMDTRITNDSGSYNFPSVPPGNYKMTADLKGFSPAVQNNVEARVAAQLRMDFVLTIADAPGAVVNVQGEYNPIQDSSASVGTTLSQTQVKDLPILGNNVLDLLNVLPGFRLSPVFASASTVGGLGLDSINATINGMTTNSSRDAAQLFGPLVLTTTVVNPDLVGEIRLILAPVDAELGHGNAQVQISTRSGTNKFSGAATWVVRNTALNANSWTNNHTPTLVNGVQVSNKTTPDWSNVQQGTISFGGPIIKNKTFFFALYDQQWAHARGLVSNVVLTDSARNGIFRYYPGWNPLNAAGPNPTSFPNIGTGSWISVDNVGNPVAPAFNPDGTSPYTGQLTCFSVFGNIKADGSAFGPLDCPGGNAVVQPAWDINRPAPDGTGYIQKLLSLAPHANNFTTLTSGQTNGGDGLNTAVNRYLRHVDSGNSGGDTFGTAAIGSSSSAADAVARKQINVKVDHNINNNHRISAQYTFELDEGASNVAPYENGYNGTSRRKPSLLTINGTSTLSSSLVNEARFGVNYSQEWQSPAWANLSDPDTSAAAQALLFQGQVNAATGVPHPVIYAPGAQINGIMVFSGLFGVSDFANTSPLWDFADTIRWSTGKHAFSAGFEYRRPESTGFSNSSYGNATTGNPAGLAPPALIANNTNFQAFLPGLNATSRTLAQNMIYQFHGSVANVTTQYWINNQDSITKGVWSDATTDKDDVATGDPRYGHQSRKQIQNQYSAFFKDDFKIMKRLTLNLGIRYDKFQSIYLANGLTNRFYQDGVGLYGAGRPAGNIETDSDLLANWLRPPTTNAMFLTGYGSSPTVPLDCQMGVANPNGIPTSNCDPSLKTVVQFVGPGSANPHDTLVPDNGQFSPAVGFSWQLPFFKDGSTTLRGGFQRTYGQAGSTFAGGLLSGPGGSDSPAATAILSNPCAIAKLGTGLALDISDIACLSPMPPSRAPGAPISLTARACCTFLGNSYASYAPDYKTPYTDNYTLSVTHNMGSKLTIDARFVSTIGKGLGAAGSFGSAGSIDLNTINVYHNPELLKALDDTRAGLNSPFFDELLMGVNLNAGTPGYGAVGTCVAAASSLAGSGVSLSGTPCAAGQVLQRGSMQIRRAYAANLFPPGSFTIQPGLANGNYVGVLALLLNTLNSASGVGTTGLQPDPTGIDPATGAAFTTSQRVLRNGCNRLANGLTGGFTTPEGTVITPRCLPENFMIANPQHSSSIYASNYGHSTYNSGQITFTARPIQGVNIQATYGLSKTLALPGNGYTDPLNKQLDYGITLGNLGQDFKANGSVELPFGPNKLVLGNSSGLIARIVERWQTSFIYTIAQGSPRSMLGTSNMLYANGRPDIVGPWNNPKGEVQWNGATGSYFGTPSPYLSFKDPQCTNGTVGNTTATDPNGFNLTANCTLLGLGQIVPVGTPGAIASNNGAATVLPLLQNPLPGHQGNLGTLTMNTLPRWSLDANISKNFRISESKALQFRMDATNIFNHPTSGDPAGLNSLGSSLVDNFGQITTKTGNRQFQGSLRFSF